MSGTRRHHPPEVVERVRQLLSLGESVANIERRLHVSKSTIKRQRAEMNKEKKSKEEAE